MAKEKKMSLGEKLHGVAHAIPGYGIMAASAEKGEKMKKERERIKDTRGSPKHDKPKMNGRDENHNYSGYGRG